MIPKMLKKWIFPYSSIVLYDNKKNINKEFDEIITLLQKEILQGNIEYDDKTKKILLAC